MSDDSDRRGWSGGAGEGAGDTETATVEVGGGYDKLWFGDGIVPR